MVHGHAFNCWYYLHISRKQKTFFQLIYMISQQNQHFYTACQIIETKSMYVAIHV